MKQLNLIEVNYRDAVNSGNVAAAIEKAVTARIGELIIEGATLNDFIKYYPSIIPVGIPRDWGYDEGKQIEIFYDCIHIRENKTFLDSELTLDQLETLFCRTYGSSSKESENKENLRLKKYKIIS